MSAWLSLAELELGAQVSVCPLQVGDRALRRGPAGDGVEQAGNGVGHVVRDALYRAEDVGAHVPDRRGAAVPEVERDQDDCHHHEYAKNQWGSPAVVHCSSSSVPGGCCARDGGSASAPGVRHQYLTQGLEVLDTLAGAEYHGVERVVRDLHDAFTYPLPGELGDAGRNTIPGPWSWSLNTAFGRYFTIGGEGSRKRIELRLETNNTLNHVNITNVNTVFGSALYGLPTTAGAMRTADINIRFRF